MKADADYQARITEGLRALSAVQKVYPSAILAGGYLRDAFFGRSQKDIDIFVDYSEVITGLPGSVVNTASGYMDNGDVDLVWELKGYALPVQVIMLREGLTAMSRCLEHDFDFCQIWHDGWSTGCTSAFANANMDEITLVHCENQKEFDRSMRRWKRLSVKYPECVLVIPERFHKYD